MMVLLILQSGLRNVAVGSDTYRYYEYFIDIQNTEWNTLLNNLFSFYILGEGKDPGYLLFIKIIQIIIPTFQLYLIALAAFFFYALGKLFYKVTNNNYEVLLGVALYQCLFYSFFSITGLRQTMATAVLLLAIPYVLEKKLFKFLLLVLLASTQHKSAFLFAPFYLLNYVGNPKRLVIYAFIAFAPMWLFGKSFAINIITDTIFEQYSAYLEDNEKAGAYAFAVFMLCIGIWILAADKKFISLTKYNKILISSIAVAIFLTPLAMIDPSNMRIIQYYSVFSIFVLPYLTTVSFKENRTLYLILIAVLTAYTMTRNFDYAFFWQEMALGSNYQ